MVSKEEGGMTSPGWVGRMALLDKAAKRAVRGHAAMVLQEAGGGGAPIRVEVEKGKKREGSAECGGQAAADGPSWEMTSDS